MNERHAPNSPPMTAPPADADSPPDDLDSLHAWWRAANYLSVGQIYLLDNPLLREPLTPQHVKPRLLGHWGTTPGLNFIYAHLNRVIRAGDLDMILVTGPGHGGPALVASTWLEGSYSEHYPQIGRDLDGMKKLFRQFSFPGGIGSHATPEVPGSIHEGGELGYSLSHAFGAAFDNPELIVTCVVGDGEAETGPLAAAWHSNKFLDPAIDGAVLPILHLNGYKIANPAVLARIPHSELDALLTGYGWHPVFVEGSDPHEMHEAMAAALDQTVLRIREIQQHARAHPQAVRPRWPMIVLRSPKGWTGPKTVDGLKTEGHWRSHQVPFADPRSNPEHLALLEQWLLSYRPAELFDTDGRPRTGIVALAPTGARRMGSNPQANGGLLLREVETRTGLLAKFAQCFDDYRDGEKIEHSVADLLKQRIFALALGYEDLNDHEQLRRDPLLAAACDKLDPLACLLWRLLLFAIVYRCRRRGAVGATTHQRPRRRLRGGASAGKGRGGDSPPLLAHADHRAWRQRFWRG